MMRRISLVALLALTLTAQPAAADFHGVAKGLRMLGFERTPIPFLGLARTFVRIVHPKGIHDFQLAVYEKPPRISVDELEKMLRRTMGGGFTPVVRVTSKRKGETVFVYAKPGSDARLVELIVLTRERNEAVLVRLSADAEVVARELKMPQKIRANMASR